MGRRKKTVGKGGVLKEDQGQGSKLTAGADDSNSRTLYNGSSNYSNSSVTTRTAAAKRRRAASEQGKAPEEHQALTAGKVLLPEENGVVSKEGDLVSSAADLTGLKLEVSLTGGGGGNYGVLKEGNLGATELKGEGKGISLVFTSVAERVKRRGRRTGKENNYPNNNVDAVSISVGEGDDSNRSSKVEEEEGFAEEGENKERKKVEACGMEDENMELLENNGEEDAGKNELRENGELGEKELNLENGEEEGVEEESRQNKEGNRSDEGEEGKGDCVGRRRCASQRKSSMEARLKMVRMSVEEEELEEGEKSKRKRRRGSKGKKEVGGESEGHQEEVNGENKKRRRGRKPSKAAVEKGEEENSGNGGELMGGEEKERVVTEEKKGGKRQRRIKGEGDGEEGKEEEEEATKMSRDARYSLRAKKLVTGEASKLKRMLKDENGNIIESNMCHQCQRNDKGEVIRCTMCKTKRYCLPCIKKWYETLVADK